MTGRDEYIRDNLTKADRTKDLVLTIDPGYVHHRKIETILGRDGMRIVDELIAKIPNVPEWQRSVRIDHIYTRCLLAACQAMGVPVLRQLIAHEKGRLFCSTEPVLSCPDVYDVDRAVSWWNPPTKFKWNVRFEYGTKLISGDTLRSRLHNGNDNLAIIAEYASRTTDTLTFIPLVMGFPWLEDSDSLSKLQGAEWYSSQYFENYIEDFDEFSLVDEVPSPIDWSVMESISEYAFKVCLAEILGGTVAKDWGGEQSDFFTSHLHLNGKRVTGTFLLKGPARFAPMGLNHLGKNNDQIVRLAHEPATVLFVQHSHEILPAVRETLRAFAVQPGNPRRYCMIDGRDSLRLLTAYGLVDRAIELSSRR